MIELSRHIESLMLKHDCVIVPGLGGFVTQYVPARRVEDELLFLPPYRSVGFNQQLTLNDGLLVQSYMQAYDTNYPETIKLIDDAVRQLKDELQRNGEYELSGIGKLSMQIGGQYHFIPCEAGVLSPELYGLDALTIKKLETNGTTRKKYADDSVSSKKVQVKRTERNYTISVSRELVNYVAAVVVAVFFYFLWATPVTSTMPVDKQAASVVYEQLFTNVNTGTAAAKDAAGVKPAESRVGPAASKPAAKPVVKETKPQPHEAASQAPPTSKPVCPASTTGAPAKNGGKFTLVLASSIPKHSADEYARKLQQSGFAEAQSYVSGRMVRVIYGLYATEGEALKHLHTLRKNKEFNDAWILKLK